MYKGDGDPHEGSEGRFSFSRFLDGDDEDWGEREDFSFDTGWDRVKDPWSLDLDDPEHEDVDDEDLSDESLGASDIEDDELDDDLEDDLDDLEESLDDHLEDEDEDEDEDDEEWD